MAMRVGISLNDEEASRLSALAEFDCKKVATLVSELVKQYMDTRKDDIELILKARHTYEQNVAELRKGK